jgi:hypothetical protein
VGPQTENLHDPLPFEDLIDQAMLDVDAARTGARQVTEELLKRRRRLKRVSSEESQESLGPRAKTRARQLP